MPVPASDQIAAVSAWVLAMWNSRGHVHRRGPGGITEVPGWLRLQAAAVASTIASVHVCRRRPWPSLEAAVRLRGNAARGFMSVMRNQSPRAPGRKVQLPQPQRGHKSEEHLASAAACLC